jgi:hypothetical protein
MHQHTIQGDKKMNQQDTEREHKLLSDKLNEFYDHMSDELRSMISEGKWQVAETNFINRVIASLRPYFLWGLFSNEHVPRGCSSVEELRKFKSEETVILGFAFGMTKKGRPGKSNEDMANIIQEYINEKRYAEWNKVFVQWEIADALQDHHIPLDNIANPPSFTSNDVINPIELTKKLYRRETHLLNYVYNSLPKDVQHVIEQQKDASEKQRVEELIAALVAGLNSILHLNTFHILDFGHFYGRRWPHRTCTTVCGREQRMGHALSRG